MRISRTAVVASAVLALPLLPTTAEAQIGLSHAKRGQGYLSIEGGYQNRDTTTSTAPQAGGTNPYNSGISVQERAFASPDKAEASSSISDGANTASGSVGTDRGGTEASASTEQVNGNQAASTSANVAATATPNSSDATSFTNASALTGSPVLPPSSGAASTAQNGNATAAATAASTGDVSASSATSASVPVAPPPFDSSASSTNTANGNAGMQAAAAGGAVATSDAGGGQSASVAAAAAASQVAGFQAVASAGGTQTGAGLVASTGTVLTGQPQATTVAVFNNATGAPQATTANANGQGALARLDAEHGAYGGLSFGFVLPQRALGLIDRVELFGTFSNNNDDRASTGFGFTALSSDGRAALALFDTNGIRSTQSVRDEHRELGIRFKSDNFTDTSFPLIVSFEPFYKKLDTEASALVGADFELRAKTDADLYGLQLGLETEVPIVTALSFVGRVSGGVYAIDVDGEFSERLGSYGLASSGSETETGYRLGAEAGLRLKMGATSFVTVTGAVDHLSDAPTSALGNSAKSLANPVTLDEKTDYQAKLNLTFRNGD